MSEKPRFDLTLNLGHVIILVGALVGFVSSSYRTDGQLAGLQAQVATLQTDVRGLSSLLVENATTRAELRALERRVEFMERR